MARANKVIITCAVTGAIHTPSMSPYLPVTPDEIIAAGGGSGRGRRGDPASACPRSRDRQAGPDAGGVRALPAAHQAGDERRHQHHHGRQPLHARRGAREAGGRDSSRKWRRSTWARSISAFTGCSTATRNSSSTGSSRRSKATRDLVFRNSFKDIEYVLKTCYGNDTRFEFECYDIAHLYNLKHFLDRGLVKPPLFVQSVFGILGGIGTHPEDVMHMKRTADRLFGDQYRWSVLGAGASQMRIAAQAAAMGGNVRVGLEDSLWAGPGKLAKSNAEQVRLARQILEGLGLEIATPDEAREILELKGGDRVNF